MMIEMQTGNNEISELRLPNFFCDGMVMQRNKPLKVWGWAKPNQSVSVRFLGTAYPTVSDSEGKWLVTLPQQQAGGPYEMEISAGETILLHNILIGEVWFCSGQSNMQMTMERVEVEAPEYIENDNYPSIRLFTVPMKYDFNDPHDNVDPAVWEPAVPGNITRFTATGYFFARELHKKYGIPVGLINTAVGGTPVESWMSREALADFPELLAKADICKDSQYIQNVKGFESKREQQWYADLDERDPGLQGSVKWYDENYDDSAWNSISLPSYWADEGLQNANGVFWFRKEITIPTSMTGVPAKIFMGRIVDFDCVYINGVLVGKTYFMYPQRHYDIPIGLLKPGKNTITVRVYSNRGKGGFIQEKPYKLQARSESLDLTGVWKGHVGAIAATLAPTTFFEYKPIGMFNGIVYPFLNYAIKGVLWYQGESNTECPENYDRLFAKLIQDWRLRWQEPDLPFLYVQLPNYLERENLNAIGKWALLREAQQTALKLGNTGMAVTMDIGDWNDMHPLNKQSVGKRLAQCAYSVVYKEKGAVPMGPIYRSMEIQGDKILLDFDYIGAGLVSKDGKGLNTFEISAIDGVYYQAEAFVDGDRVVVHSDKVSSPAFVRYAWCDCPMHVNFYNRNGLPAAPFRTFKNI